MEKNFQIIVITTNDEDDDDDNWCDLILLMLHKHVLTDLLNGMRNPSSTK